MKLTEKRYTYGNLWQSSRISVNLHDETRLSFDFD